MERKITHQDVVNKLKSELELLLPTNSLGFGLKQEFIREKLRFDLVIVKNHHIVYIIEVKNWKKDYHKRSRCENSKQMQKYRKFGLKNKIPVILCGGMWDIERVKTQIINLF